jgi:hypothetical protein
MAFEAADSLPTQSRRRKTRQKPSQDSILADRSAILAFRTNLLCSSRRSHPFGITSQVCVYRPVVVAALDHQLQANGTHFRDNVSGVGASRPVVTALNTAIAHVTPEGSRPADTKMSAMRLSASMPSA